MRAAVPRETARAISPREGPSEAAPAHAPARRDGTLLAAGLFYVGVAEPHITRWGSTEAERPATWPGDELVAHAGLVWTNAVTIDRPAAEVWPWVTQLGQGRGGLYS